MQQNKRPQLDKNDGDDQSITDVKVLRIIKKGDKQYEVENTDGQSEMPTLDGQISTIRDDPQAEIEEINGAMRKIVSIEIPDTESAENGATKNI